MKDILYTFDYELFLGNRSGNAENCILKPTNKLLKVLNRHNAKGIFFVDTLYLWRLKNQQETSEQTKKDYDAIVAQLREALKKGHYIFPHLHAHWLDAVYLPDINEWDLTNIRYYRFSSLPSSLQEEVFSISIRIIREITEAVVADYQIDSYRAGGWSIQPFKDFKPYFEKYDIKYDFSVIPGKKSISPAHSFDFIKAPQKNIYQFENYVETEQPGGKFTELTISTAYAHRFGLWCWFKIKAIQKRLNINKPYGNGSVLDLKSTDQLDIHESKKIPWVWAASMEGLNVITFFIYLRKIISANYYQFISHPKLLTPLEIKWFNILLFCIKPFKYNSDYKKILR